MARGWSKGFSILETAVTLGIVAAVVPALLVAIGTAIFNTDHVYDRSVLFELAQSQMEEVQRQAYQENAASYTLISTPAGYSVSVSVSPPATYVYPAPKSTNTQETVQLVTVTVTGVRGNLQLEGYKVRR